MTRLLTYAADVKLAKRLWGKTINHVAIRALKQTMESHSLSLVAGDLIFLEGRWYVTSGGLLGLARRNRCAGIHVEPVPEFSNATASRWAFKATVYKSRSCKGFVGYGDADPSNVSPLFHGAELRIAETRATNRALRKAYSISICSTEELASSAGSPGPGRESKRLPPQPANGNHGALKIRDRFCQIIRQHQLDPTLVKAYATDFCGAKTLREATREQVENFVAHLAEWAEKDRNALLCQLNSYLPPKEGAA